MPKEPPKCKTCGNPMVPRDMTAILAPPAPAMMLTTYGCDTCHPRKEDPEKKDEQRV